MFILVHINGLILYAPFGNCVFHLIMSGDISVLAYMNSFQCVPVPNNHMDWSGESLSLACSVCSGSSCFVGEMSLA